MPEKGLQTTAIPERVELEARTMQLGALAPRRRTGLARKRSRLLELFSDCGRG
ncbi:hypothetical protein KKC1_16040 [Calderihabitans maritimus]|uniref:Uncharacterized protein n=1 Tax=Calderihabitans maritimus TaxID=1246530 RepID=A0A1Z5HT54_9FIRM|nr:hypothetical protein KKC1_16040 [Calderihabitans maritimus]